MSATSVRVASSAYGVKADMVRVGGRQVKLCDPLAIGSYLSALEMRFTTKRYTNRRSLLLYFSLHVSF